MNTKFNKSIVCFCFGGSLFLLLISLIIVYFSIEDKNYPMLGLVGITGGTCVSIYFFVLFDLLAIELVFNENTIQFKYPFSIKKSKSYSITDLLGYYIFTDGPQRRIVLVFSNKKEYQLIESYYLNFKQWQDYIFETYQMISHKNYKVYSSVRKTNELAMYNALYSYNEKEEYEYYTFKLYGLLIGGIIGILFSKFKYGFEVNWFTIIGIALIVSLYLYIRNRTYVSTLEKERLNKEKE